MLKYNVYLRVYGERNSGTNFVEQLITANFAVTALQSKNRVNDHRDLMGRSMSATDYAAFQMELMDLDSARIRYSDFGWKHGAPPLAEIAEAPHSEKTLFVCVAKHPVAWLRSLCARPYSPLEKTPERFSEFIRYRMPVSFRDNLPGIEKLNVIELWNIKNASFSQLPLTARNCIVRSYEQVLIDPLGFLESVGHHLLRKSEAYIWDLPSTKGDGLSFDDYRSKYDLSTEYKMAGLEDLEHIQARVDHRVMAAFGYDPAMLRPLQSLINA